MEMTQQSHGCAVHLHPFTAAMPTEQPRSKEGGGTDAP